MTQNSGLSAIERGIPQGFLGGVIGLLFTYVLQASGYLPGGALMLFGGGVILGLVAWAVNYALLSTSGRAARSVHMPSGDTTAYVPTFSHIEALEIRGDLHGASIAWAEACVEHAGNALVRVKAADFHLRIRKDHATALLLYREAREIDGASRELVRYAQAKIVDIYLGPMRDEGRAMVELRRTIDAFPGTREADEARIALARLKASRDER